MFIISRHSQLRLREYRQWNPTDDGLFVLASSPANSPKCLAVLLASVGGDLGDGAMEINSCGTSAPDWMRWSRCRPKPPACLCESCSNLKG